MNVNRYCYEIEVVTNLARCRRSCIQMEPAMTPRRTPAAVPDWERHSMLVDSRSTPCSKPLNSMRRALAWRQRFMRRASRIMWAQTAMSTVKTLVETASRQTCQVPVHDQPSSVSASMTRLSGPKRLCLRRRALRARVRQSRRSMRRCTILTTILRTF